MANRDSESPKVSSPAKGARCTLPTEKVFSIQIGAELFRLSGASIASDAPSYFSRFFEGQLRQNPDRSSIRTLYIDRDPDTFREIAKHLQGYHVQPKDESQFVRLFADAQFYSLPRLISQLFESQIFIQIGERHFQIPRDIFSGPGDSPNFFSLGFGAFFASPSEIFPGLDRHGLLRPPAIAPPCVANRSGDVFAELLHLLRGYPLHIRSEEHRAELLRDCRYFHLRGLEQKLIPHHISFNPIRKRSEIVIRLDDVRPSGVQFTPESQTTADGWVTYSRPFVDETPHDLIMEIGDENTLLDLAAMCAAFGNLAKARVSSLVRVIASRIGLDDGNSLFAMNTEQSPAERLSVRLERETDLIVNGRPTDSSELSKDTDAYFAGPPAKRKRGEEGPENSVNWIVRNGQWRLRIETGARTGPELVLVAVKLNVYTEQRIRNRTRAFLGS